MVLDDLHRADGETLALLWMLIRTECIRGPVFATRAGVNLALFEYVDGFDNSRRIQKRLGASVSCQVA
ncbi:IS3 family transposase [Streptomyces sp. MBT65]|uniref:IS3 family transposase n=1 Tax=Streptomyces sp. MBT65 TaxID=1488395 RepID=UPI0027DA2308|nr:IS3 family transposase [Streptomyces sp. MBT65]